MNLTILILLISASLKAPSYPAIVIPAGEVINGYERIIRAVTTVESANGKYLLNEKEMAVGWFGIRPIRLLDYNQRTGKHITHEQCYEYETGRMIFLYYASQIHPSDIKAICINWNGVSKKNLYYQKIKSIL
jgi:hypothetical protein